MLWYIGRDDATKDSKEALSSDEIRSWIKMIYAREPGDKASFPRILVTVSAKERAERLKSVGLRINEATKSCEPIDDSTIPTTTQDVSLLEAVVVHPSEVAKDLPVAIEATVLEVDESTPTDPATGNLILDQQVKDIASDFQ